MSDLLTDSEAWESMPSEDELDKMIAELDLEIETMSSRHGWCFFACFRAISNSFDRLFGGREGNGFVLWFDSKTYTSNSDTAVMENIRKSPSARPLKVANSFQPPAKRTCVIWSPMNEVRFTVHAFVDGPDRRMTDFPILSPCFAMNGLGSACTWKTKIKRKIRNDGKDWRNYQDRRELRNGRQILRFDVQ